MSPRRKPPPFSPAPPVSMPVPADRAMRSCEHGRAARGPLDSLCSGPSERTPQDPPAAISATSIFTEVQPEGVVNVYQTSYFVPAHEPAMPELVALYNVLDVVTQLLFGVSEMGAEQSSDCCANENFEPIIKRNNNMPVRAVVIGDMVFQGF